MKINYEQLFLDHYIEYWSEGKNVTDGWLNIRCPHCDDHSNHLGFNPDTGSCFCWKCGPHSAAASIGLVLNISGGEAQNIIKGYSHEDMVRKKVREKLMVRPKKIIMPGKELTARHKKYLVKRNFDPDTIVEKYQIKGTALHAQYPHRIIIPIFYKRKLVSFQTRDITGKASLRYITSSEEVVPHKNILYNLDNCFQDRCMVVEGVTDVWRFGDNVVCTFGTAYTPKQVELLSLHFKQVTVLFDPEPTAQARAKTLCLDLSDYGVEAELLYVSGEEKDPADFSEDLVRHIKRELKI